MAPVLFAFCTLRRLIPISQVAQLRSREVRFPLQVTKQTSRKAFQSVIRPEVLTFPAGYRLFLSTWFSWPVIWVGGVWT